MCIIEKIYYVYIHEHVSHHLIGVSQFHGFFMASHQGSLLAVDAEGGALFGSVKKTCTGRRHSWEGHGFTVRLGEVM